jgi:hypothetical protein
VTWVNKDVEDYTITSRPGPGVSLDSDLPSGTNFDTAVLENSILRYTFTEPGGFHYEIGSLNLDIKGAIIVK